MGTSGVYVEPVSLEDMEVPVVEEEVTLEDTLQDEDEELEDLEDLDNEEEEDED